MKKFDVTELLKTAEATAGLTDFGPADFFESLAVFVDGLNSEAEIRPQSRPYLHDRLQRLLVNRLWFAKDLEAHPEIMNEDTGSPIIIASLPRTGSTKLHRMLAAGGDFQTTPMWKTHMFARIPGQPDSGIAERIQLTRDYEKWMYETSPDILTGHPLFTDEAEEDQWLMECTFRHPLLFGMFHSLRYAQWLQQTDMQSSFKYFVAQIKYLQWQSNLQNMQPWLLKNPNHLGDEENLERFFNKPRFIVTHRDPAKCIPSISKAAISMRKLYSDYDASAALGAGVINMFSDAAGRHLKWRDANPDAEILDLGFDEINRGGLSACRKVYDFFGMVISKKSENAMQKWEENNQREKHGKSVYSAEAIGTTDQNIRDVFADYIQRFSDFL